MPLTGIQSVSVYVNDIEQAVDFYTNKLGFDKTEDAPLFEGGDLRWVTVAPPGSNTQIVLVKGYADWSPERVGKFSGFVFNVDNIVDTFNQLEARGVEIVEKPSKQIWGMQAQFKDQDGNTFVVVGH
jgi:predicted enzyme related to lactoylglutathione lyase